MDRIENLLSQMTLEEKASMVAGSGPWHSTPVERLGIPAFKMTDGPNGARGDAQSGATAACFPVGSALAATWNPDLIKEVGQALAQEAKSKSAQVLLGPTMNLHRTPLGGRNFECYSEDPHLTGKIGAAFVDGVQSEGIAACPKHFICNDSEYQRHTMSSEVDEQTLREVYLAPFEHIVEEAQPWAIMSSYNRINGAYASSHTELLSEVIKKEWEFDGIVISDWGASLEPVDNANGGLDLEMPGPARAMGKHIAEAVKAGDVSEEILDDKVRRLLRLVVRTGKLDEPSEAPERSEDRPEHRVLARRAAAEAMVLIKNDGVLPLDRKDIKKLAVIGPNGATSQIQGGGSSGVAPHYESHPLDAIRTLMGDACEITFEPGCLTNKYAPAVPRGQLVSDDGSPGLTYEIYQGPGLTGPKEKARVLRRNQLFFGFTDPMREIKNFSCRLSGTFTPDKTGLFEFGLMSAGLSRLFIDGVEVIDNWSDQTPGESFFSFGSAEKCGRIQLNAGQAYLLEIQFEALPDKLLSGVRFGVIPPTPDNLLERALDAAKDADAVVLIAGTNADWETEGNDRAGLQLPGEQDTLITAVTQANPNTVLVLNTGSAVAMPWIDQVPAVLQAWFPGQEFGNALTDILFGDKNPSGKMPSTFPKRLEDTPAFTNYPGERGRVHYGERLHIGYRWYRAHNIEPLVPFGHGLCYTTFTYSDLEVPSEVRSTETIPVKMNIMNSGSREGAEVVQLYVESTRTPGAAPIQMLKAFKKVSLTPGEEQRIEFHLPPRALAYWDTRTKSWQTKPGTYNLLIGASSCDTRLQQSLSVVE